MHIQHSITGLILTVMLLSASTTAYAQETPAADPAPTATPKEYKNTLGIDLANILTFLSKKSESYLINYKRNISGPHNLRTGMDLEWSTDEFGSKMVNARIGYEYQTPIVSNHWKLFWGVDLNYMYWSANYQNNKTYRYGATPLLGFAYYPVARFSISTEIGINVYHTRYRNPASFDPAANRNVWDINIGSVGMLMVNYHF